ncbi:cytochrome d ubiquinol oxidase subunit II [Desulfurivibrio alkaliphilus]|uniref:Cytochrome d ubiquinol oxidase, subunit II n=1 Tax=Desulfurivibrio alkaliphilus (strain DSM 19089 / UNIQEM U267 / AHT2) TaxID=589865 RepID=D6Z1S0_DESAT|nr:cytochrome d ubiquinol oxidase subunit II [Desulfurivibrio alkaliphilus]ADH85495.1 cytochrome d ubiquinol oxidase, subunit II [Desulfurivibrio alkaliphilus AHT 2]
MDVTLLGSIWFLLWGVLWAVYFALDGYDLGLGINMPLLAAGEGERRVIYNAAGPFWDGNQVWLITAGGVTFAAFPATYAALFSGLYSALMLLLFALIFRGVSFEFRRLVDSDGWRRFWDLCNVLGSFLPALLFGVAFANIFMGIPLNAQQINEGGLLALLNPYGLAGGVLFVLLFALHGCLWLTVKADGRLQRQAAAMAAKQWLLVLLVVPVFLLLTLVYTDLFANYLRYPALLTVLLVPVAGLLAAGISLRQGAHWRAWLASGVTIIGITMFGVIGLYPRLLPSSLDPDFSMTIANSASSPLTLKIMLGVALVFVPIVIAYQTWVHLKFGHKLSNYEDLRY